MNPDTVNSAWRSIISGENNVLLANIAFRHGTAVLKLAGSAGLLDEAGKRESAFFMTSVDKNDFSSSFRIFWQLFPTTELNRRGFEKKLRLGPLLRRSVDALSSRTSSGPEKSGYRRAAQRGNELENLFSVLHHARNVNAHEHGVLSDIGFATVAASACIRILELAELDADDFPRRDALRSDAAKCLVAAVEFDPMDDFEPHISASLEKSSAVGGVEHVQPPPPDNDRTDGHGAELNEKLSKLQEQNEVLLEKLGLLEGQIFSSEDGDEDDAEDGPVAYEPDDKLTIEQARQKLAELSKKIKDEDENAKDLSPAENFLQKPIVNAMLSKKIRNFEDWQNLSDVGWRYIRYKPSMKPVIDSWWDEVQKILDRIDWTKELLE